MDKIQLLKTRRKKLKEAGVAVRDDIAALIDEESFVELSAFSFSDKEFYGDEAEGEGVVTGYATIDDYPYYVVAQNFGVKSGGISKAACDKILKCLDMAERNSTPVIYLLNTAGVKLEDGVSVLEGLAALLSRAAQLKGVINQYAVINGDVFGSAALIASACDFAFFMDKSVLAVNSPVVLSAKEGKNLPKEKVGGAEAVNGTGAVSFSVKTLEDVREKIADITEILSDREADVSDAALNESVPALNSAPTAKNIISSIECAVEVGAGYGEEVKTVLGRIGGISVAAVVFDGGADGVELTAENVRKLSSFVCYAADNGLPFVTFVNTKGVKCDMATNSSPVMNEISGYLYALASIDAPKISVVYGKAVGLGYTLFAAKSAGYDYTCAFATAKIALFDSVQGAEIELGGGNKENIEKYSSENSDPVNAAKDGFIDDVIEPQFVKQYIIESLEMLLN